MLHKDVLSTPKDRATLSRLVSLAAADYYNPQQYFTWPTQLPASEFWMSRDLLTTYCTDADRDLSVDQLVELSHHEVVHFFSLNVHGIRDLLGRVVAQIYTTGFEHASEFFHHFLREENDHMWFFAKFCNTYGGKIYAQRALRGTQSWPANVELLLAFVRIGIFEEIVDHFNVRMAADESLHPFIRDLNRIHHRDESRHIAFGRHTVAALYQDVTLTAENAMLDQISDYVCRYIQTTVASIYNPSVYRDARLPGSPYAWREKLLNSPQRRTLHSAMVRRPVSFLRKTGILKTEVFGA